MDRIPQYTVDSFMRLDLGMTWRPNDTTEVSLWGQNLLEPSHEGYHSTYFKKNKAKIERAFFLSIRKKF